MTRTVAFTVATLLICLSVSAPSAEAMTDAQIKRAIIQESIASYPGNCPCPYNVARNGSMCGRRSAYSRPGGYSPICYESDVTDQAIRDYHARHGVQP